MKCKPCTYSQESEAGYLQTESSDTRQLSLLSGMDTPARYCANEPQKDGSRGCECGKETSGCSIHPNTPDEWIASMRDSLARTLASLENRQGLERKRAVVYTAKSSASLAWFDRASCTLRTSQQSLLTDSEPSSLTLPRSGMTRNGYVYELPIVGRTTSGTGGGYSLPTPTVAMEAPNKNANTNGPKNLVEVAKGQWNHLWPTPAATDFKGSVTGLALENRMNMSRGVRLPEQVMRMFSTPLAPRAHDSENTAGKYYPSQKQKDLTSEVAANGGQLNPMWVEWLMAFPLGFTVSRDWVTRKSRCKPQPHGDCSEVNE